MTNEPNRKIVEEYMTAWSKADDSKLNLLIDSSFKFNAPPGFTGDKQGAIDMAKAYHSAFPDMAMKYTTWLTDGNQVAVRCSVSGTHKGSFMGVPASNKHAETTGLALVTLRNGKIIEDASEFDMLGLMTQIGAIPPLGESAPSGGSSAGRSNRWGRPGERDVEA